MSRLEPCEILEVVRRHWRIENECFWTLDTPWKEDSGLWVHKGNGLMVSGILRMIACTEDTWLAAGAAGLETPGRSLSAGP